jgi:uncharacterized membrane protein YjjP (DUF1212 family)
MQTNETKQIRRMVSVFIILLVLSGVTAFPLTTEVHFLMEHIDAFPTYFHPWITTVYESVTSTSPVVLYGTDWLAFAHIIIALFFIGVYIDPVRNRFIIDIGIVACVGIIPLAFICGPVRNIPFYHQLIACSFGILGMIPLFYVKRKINLLERTTQTVYES